MDQKSSMARLYCLKMIDEYNLSKYYLTLVTGRSEPSELKCFNSKTTDIKSQ